jgi:hypothetical protein
MIVNTCHTAEQNKSTKLPISRNALKLAYKAAALAREKELPEEVTKAAIAAKLSTRKYNRWLSCNAKN